MNEQRIVFGMVNSILDHLGRLPSARDTEPLEDPADIRNRELGEQLVLMTYGLRWLTMNKQINQSFQGVPPCISK